MQIESGFMTIAMSDRKRLAIIAHDNCKGELLEWARYNRGTLADHDLYATGTTGGLLTSELGLPVVRFASGPLGGDQQVGAFASGLCRTLLVLSVLIIGSATVVADDLCRLSGWAAIPFEYRHPGPVSGQFAGPANGVTPPYSGQPIPGFSGMIRAETPGEYIALPDNGFGAQGNSADFVIGFYTVRPIFKTSGDGTTEPGPVDVLTFTPLSDPHGLLRLTPRE
jgi:hypothetical protein